jgi:hypothetical protein
MAIQQYDAVCSPGEPFHHGLAMTSQADLLSLSLFLSLRRVSPLEM